MNNPYYVLGDLGSRVTYFILSLLPSKLVWCITSLEAVAPTLSERGLVVVRFGVVVTNT